MPSLDALRAERTARARSRALLSGFVVLIVAGLSLRPPTSDARPLPHVRHVLLIGVPGLGLDDITTPAMPRLRQLTRDGAVAAMNVRTQSRYPSSLEAYATIGAGARVGVPAGATAELARGSEGLARLESRAAAAARSAHLSGIPGGLGDALERAGVVPLVVGPRGPDAANPPEVLGLVDTRGRARFAPTQSSDAAVSSTANGSVVLVDAADFAGRDDDVHLADRGRWAAIDAVVGELTQRLRHDAVALIVGVTPPTRTWALTPIVAVGPGLRGRTLVSPTTRRPGLVTIGDVAPTILASLGLRSPPSFTGRPIAVAATRTDVTAMQRLNRSALFRERVYFPLAVGYIVIQVTCYAAVGLLARRARRRAAVPRGMQALCLLALLIAAFPLGTYLWRLAGWAGAPLGAAGLAILAVICVALVVPALWSRHSLVEHLWWLLFAGTAVIVLDVATGARLEPASIFGYSPHTSTRFYGLGNPGLALVATGVVLLAALHVDTWPTRTTVRQAGALFCVVLFVASWPSLGAKVGAMLTMVPIFGATWWCLSGRRLTWKVGCVLIGLVGLLLVGAAVWDSWQSPAHASHLGQLLTAIDSSGSARLREIVLRKLTTTGRLVAQSPWTVAIVVLGTIATVAFACTSVASDLLPMGSPRRVGVIAALATGPLGLLANDSGAVMVALVFVYVGPLLTVLAGERMSTASSPARRD